MYYPRRISDGGGGFKSRQQAAAAAAAAAAAIATGTSTPAGRQVSDECTSACFQQEWMFKESREPVLQ
jgi:Flp pilus assembly protein TadG